MQGFFACDLHGRLGRYRTLFHRIEAERPSAVFLGGDLLPHGAATPDTADFVRDVLVAGFASLRERLGEASPSVFLILGNDDPRALERGFLDGERVGLWKYLHGRRALWGRHPVYGYSCVPPTPFFLKDWERYDVSRYVDPGCIPPEEGRRSLPVSESAIRFGTIASDLEALVQVGSAVPEDSIFLFHSPPYGSLDRAALDGRKVDGVPLDVHVGSIAIARFLEANQPLLTLHGHVHESARLIGSWRARIGRTHLFSAAHDGPELALVRFDPENLDSATRELL